VCHVGHLPEGAHESNLKAGSFAFYRGGGFNYETGRSQRHVQKGLCRNVCTSTVMISPDPLPPTASTSIGLKSPQNTAKDPNNPVPADEGDIQMEYYSD